MFIKIYMRMLQDVKDLKLTANPAYKPAAEKGDGYVDHQTSPYICPVIGLEMNGKFKFVFIWSCGCVMSERALKEVKTNVCHNVNWVQSPAGSPDFRKWESCKMVPLVGGFFSGISRFPTHSFQRHSVFTSVILIGPQDLACQKEFLADDVVILNATGEDLKKMEMNLEARRERARMEKKAKKTEKSRASDETVSSTKDTSSSGGSQMMATSSIPKPNGKQNGKLISNRVNMLGKRSVDGELADPQFKKAKSSYSVAKDPKATSVFKSLFTSHPTALGQTKAHWITYNPFYN
ncbi:hypothetical protein PR048_033515 [Dryococelus australis]|uniref:Replication termination factor 2 n=1 Tax=Dryococelus australis TaxID=614101 RepID=A0ABQ9G3B6_9NEOP|nr:hypothetical protein PR048_033515 [Dryococelus australis]